MLLSVLVITYNHEKYVAQALESALEQRLEVEWEIVVGDDASTDGTWALLERYRARHPDRLRLLRRPRNVGLVRNFGETLESCRGRFVAILEGDDYWTSPDKARRQIAFLEEHRECSACFHGVRIVDDAGRPIRLFPAPPGGGRLFGLEDVLESQFISTPSVMFRSGLFGRLPDWFYDMPMGDWPLHVLNALHGSIGYLDDVLACYREHAGSAWSSLRRIEVLRRSLRAAEVMGDHLGPEAIPALRRRMAHLRREITSIHYRDGRYREALGEARALMSVAPRLGLEYRRGLWLYLKSAVHTAAARP